MLKTELSSSDAWKQVTGWPRSTSISFQKVCNRPDPHVQVKLTAWGSADVLSDHTQGEGSRLPSPSSDLISGMFPIRNSFQFSCQARHASARRIAMRLLLHRLTTDRRRRQPSKIRLKGESLRGASSASWEEDECELFFFGFFSSLIKANDGLSRSLYAHHRQAAGCNELLSGTWRKSRKQAAGLVSAVLICCLKICSAPNQERESCPVSFSENCALSPWFDLSRGKRKLIFSLPKPELLIGKKKQTIRQSGRFA